MFLKVFEIRRLLRMFLVADGGPPSAVMAQTFGMLGTCPAETYSCTVRKTPSFREIPNVFPVL